MRVAFGFVACALLSACEITPPARTALSPSSSEEEAAAARVQVLLPYDARGIPVVAPVEGTVCKVGAHDADPTEEEAMSQLRLAAVRRGGAAVTAIDCERSGFSLTDNCFAMITCRGVALARTR
jgi:hypothetical protein